MSSSESDRLEAKYEFKGRFGETLSASPSFDRRAQWVTTARARWSLWVSIVIVASMLFSSALAFALVPETPPLDQSFTLAAPLTETYIGPTHVLNATWTDNIPAGVMPQIIACFWFQVTNSAGQTVTYVFVATVVQAGASESTYLGLSPLAPGTYTVETFVTTASNVPISQAEFVTFTI